jgi:hypothetical protein
MRELRVEDVPSFTNFVRMPPHVFDDLLGRLEPRITKQTTRFRSPLEPGLKLAMTLRHLATGARYSSIHYGWRVAPNTMSIVIREVCEAIIDEMKEECVICPVTPADWQKVADDFWDKWNFPHTCGAIDGKHVAIHKPSNSGSHYHNYKGFFSVVMLAVVDANYKFLWVDIGGRGSNSDAQIFNHSELKECLLQDVIGLPDPAVLPNDIGEELPYYLVGDDAFALSEFMMKPFSRRSMELEERVFNYRLSRARRVVENAFGILANRWQIILNTMYHNLQCAESW